MSEKHFERKRNLEEIYQGNKERLESTVDAYLDENPGFSEVTDKEIDEILARLVEKGPELPPDVKRSLRKAVHFRLGIRLRERG